MEIKMKTIRAAEIAKIRELHAKGWSQTKIAMELNLNRLSVRYTIKKIENGETFKYENNTRVKSRVIYYNNPEEDGKKKRKAL